VQAAQSAQAEERRTKFASGIYVLNTNSSDGGIPILDFDDEYLDEEDEDGLLFTERPADQDDEEDEDEEHEHEHEHDFADEEEEDEGGEHLDHHSEHEDEHGLDARDEDFEGDPDHDQDPYDGEGGLGGGMDPYAEQPFEKETYNPYEMPSEHDYWVLPGEAERGGAGEFLSDEQLRGMGYGSSDQGQGQDPYQDEDEGEEL
jgi:hypothetical protein